MGGGKGPSLRGGNEAVDLGGSDGGAEQQCAHHEAGDLAGRQPLHLPSFRPRPCAAGAAPSKAIPLAGLDMKLAALRYKLS